MDSSLAITVDPKADRPPSEQIAAQVRYAIASGRLAVGERLPSVRQFAVEVLVNPNTIGKVWRDLAREGVLEARQGDGVFVAPGAVELCRAARDQELASQLEHWVSDARSAGLDRAQMEAVFEQAMAAGRLLRRIGGSR